MARYAGFEKRTIRFLEELAANNDREWFRANKSRYEDDVLDVALRFIISMQDPLAELAPRFTAVPTRVGGSLMRVYRDTRFSKDKQPYKTNIGIQFRHEQARDVHAPGYYVHRPQFQRTVESSIRAAEPFMRFLCKAVGVRF